MENKPFAHVSAEGERHEARQDNTSVFKHLGKFALYDHVFVQINDNQGIYLWSENENYEALAVLAVENECALHLNIQEPADVDVKAYTKNAVSQFSIPDYLPDDMKE